MLLVIATEGTGLTVVSALQNVHYYLVFTDEALPSPFSHSSSGPIFGTVGPLNLFGSSSVNGQFSSFSFPFDCAKISSYSHNSPVKITTGKFQGKCRWPAGTRAKPVAVRGIHGDCGLGAVCPGGTHPFSYMNIELEQNPSVFLERVTIVHQDPMCPRSVRRATLQGAAVLSGGPGVQSMGLPSHAEIGDLEGRTQRISSQSHFSFQFLAFLGKPVTLKNRSPVLFWEKSFISCMQRYT